MAITNAKRSTATRGARQSATQHKSEKSRLRANGIREHLAARGESDRVGK
jgi:hypothetical protein